MKILSLAHVHFSPRGGETVTVRYWKTRDGWAAVFRGETQIFDGSFWQEPVACLPDAGQETDLPTQALREYAQAQGYKLHADQDPSGWGLGVVPCSSYRPSL